MGRAELIKGEINEEGEKEGDLVCLHLQDYELEAVRRNVPIQILTEARERTYSVFTVRIAHDMTSPVKVVRDQPQRYTVYLSDDGARRLGEEKEIYRGMYLLDIKGDIPNVMIDIRKSPTL